MTAVSLTAVTLNKKKVNKKKTELKFGFKTLISRGAESNTHRCPKLLIVLDVLLSQPDAVCVCVCGRVCLRVCL